MSVRASLLSTALLFLCALPVLPCDCPARRSVQAELDASAAVFSGKVVQMHWFDKELQNFHGKRNIKPIIIVTIEVKTIWKGNVNKNVEVETDDPEENNCGVDFKKEEEYLIYAVQKQRLQTDVCTRSKTLSAASDDLKELGSGREP